jgi:hypothetical protein
VKLQKQLDERMKDMRDMIHQLSYSCHSLFSPRSRRGEATLASSKWMKLCGMDKLPNAAGSGDMSAELWCNTHSEETGTISGDVKVQN